MAARAVGLVLQRGREVDDKPGVAILTPDQRRRNTEQGDLRSGVRAHGAKDQLLIRPLQAKRVEKPIVLGAREADVVAFAPEVAGTRAGVVDGFAVDAQPGAAFLDGGNLAGLAGLYQSRRVMGQPLSGGMRKLCAAGQDHRQIPALHRHGAYATG